MRKLILFLGILLLGIISYFALQNIKASVETGTNQSMPIVPPKDLEDFPTIYPEDIIYPEDVKG